MYKSETKISYLRKLVKILYTYIHDTTVSDKMHAEK